MTVMKKTVITTLVAFFLVATGIVVYGVTRPSGGTPAAAPSASTETATAGAGTAATARTVTAAELAGHSSESDCWVAVAGSVYDVTAYIPNHPGGPGTIIPYCGKDATTAFETKGGMGSHSPRAQAMLSTMLVGTLAAN